MDESSHSGVVVRRPWMIDNLEIIKERSLQM